MDESKIAITQYKDNDREDWDKFVQASKNGTFLFLRNYMEYHKDRYVDNSLIAKRDGKIVALFPANRDYTTLYSHRGLTYGGLIIDNNMKADFMLELFSALLETLKDENFSNLVIKRIPYIYSKIPSEEDLYALFRNNAILVKRDVSSASYLENRLPYNRLRNRRIKNARNEGITIIESDNFRDFWYILTVNLKERYGKSPVHTLSEIELLKSYFPKNIKLYTAIYGDEMLSGVVVYETDTVAHLQYSASSSRGKEISAEDIIIDYLLNYYSTRVKYLDFGISTEYNGQYLNTKLLSYKESFGCRTIVYDTYEVKVNAK